MISETVWAPQPYPLSGRQRSTPLSAVVPGEIVALEKTGTAYKPAPGPDPCSSGQKHRVEFPHTLVIAPLFSVLDPREFGSVLHPLREEAKFICLWCAVSVFLFCPFVALGTFSPSSGIFLFLVPFSSSPMKTDSLAKALINTFALRCKWMIKDVFLLPDVFALQQGYKFLRVEF